MLIYSVLRKVRKSAQKQKLWQIISIIFGVLTENFYVAPFPCKFRFSFGGKFKFTKETLNFKKTRPLHKKPILFYFAAAHQNDFCTKIALKHAKFFNLLN